MFHVGHLFLYLGLTHPPFLLINEMNLIEAPKCYIEDDQQHLNNYYFFRLIDCKILAIVNW